MNHEVGDGEFGVRVIDEESLLRINHLNAAEEAEVPSPLLTVCTEVDCAVNLLPPPATAPQNPQTPAGKR